jgi:hypothetical protein
MRKISAKMVNRILTDDQNFVSFCVLNGGFGKQTKMTVKLS